MSNQVTPFRDLKIDDIRKLIDEGYEVVDVREDWEWNKGHLPGARHVYPPGDRERRRAEGRKGCDRHGEVRIAMTGATL